MKLIDIKIVKEQYERMPDEELVRFAVNEAQKISIESFHLLKSEFEVRNLDLNILETVQTEKDLAEAVKLSEFEKTTAFEFTRTIWQFAFDEKEKGKSNQVIYKALMQKKINDDYANMLIASMEPKAKELVESFDTDIIVSWIFTAAGALLLLYTLNMNTIHAAFLIWGTVMLVGGIIRLARNYTQKRKFQVVLRNIESEKEVENNLYQ